MRVGILDSGIGGLNTFSAIYGIENRNNYVYLADDLNAPFGNKSEAELMRIAERGIGRLKKLGCEIIVFACNTLTTVTIEEMRRRHGDITLIGAEPAVYPASRYGGKIALLGTVATVNSARVKKLINGNTDVDCYSFASLAGIVEHSAPHFEELDGYVKRLLHFLAGYDGVVLGCTHYIFLKPNIERVFPKIKIFDGDDGIARNVRAHSFRFGQFSRPLFLTSSGKSAGEYEKLFYFLLRE